MIRVSRPNLGILAAGLLLGGTAAHAADNPGPKEIKHIVDQTIRPLMKENDIPGMAVGITVGGKAYVFNYGIASKKSGQKVNDETLFEIGSVSKTFTATLAGYAQVTGALSLSDKATKYLPALAGSSFDTISLLDLGVYTAGGLPLQFPDNVTDQATMVAYYKDWQPAYAPGTHRLYSNASIGLFGYLAAQSLGQSFDDLMAQKVFPAFGLTHSYIHVPQNKMASYAYGYSKDGKPIRVRPGVLDSEAYGVKTTASDMIRFLAANMNGAKLDDTFRRAISVAQSGYDKIGDMTQGLGWEMYDYPVTLDRLLAGNSSDMVLKPHDVTRLSPPVPPRQDVLINKTGSTNGFGTYVAFVPAKNIGIVLLANRNYPTPARVTAAYQILTALEKQ
ncbi:class C beta-lactamase [Dongia soli]|uniref:Beta-lactamase n=1 Tax=Dongia soli TaxID=600628 RepID=A0ABU5EIN5_9PROT|nr:class C beta-lactamase [Dongia soli]MDY0885682.1 class C beta-lactamase [Dongia soli]